MKKTHFVPQLDSPRWETIQNFILAHRLMFSSKGSVVTEWRCRNGLRFGPYFRLKYREGNIQKSIYLGPSDQLAEKVRQLLENLQFRRTCRRLRKKLRTALRMEKRKTQNILHAYGYYMKGFKIHKSLSKKAPSPVRPLVGMGEG